MKKTILALAAVATIVACSKDEIVNEAPKVPIAFGDAFVENTTRAIDDPSYNTNNLKAFKVYGTLKATDNKGIASPQTVNVFDGAEVSRNTVSDPWSCTTTQYWVANCDYAFMAIAEGTTDGKNSTAVNNVGMPTNITYDATTQKDLLLATANATTNDYAEPAGVVTGDIVGSGTDKLVAFTFDHLLAKAKFTVNNTITATTGVYTYEVKDVKITNAAQKATYDISQETWKDVTASYNTTSSLDFGSVVTSNSLTGIIEKESGESEYERLLIPANYPDTDGKRLAITFTVNLYMSDNYHKDDNGNKIPQLINTTTYNKDVAIEIEKGNAYNFVINLGDPGKPIMFTVTKVNEWAPQNGPTNVPVPVE